MKKAAIAALVLFSTVASASQGLGQLVEQELSSAMSGMDAAQAKESPVGAQEWFLRRIWLRVRAKGSTQIIGFGKLEIVPEIEMLAERDLPSGWEPYKP